VCIRRFYSLMIEWDLLGTVRLVRNWGPAYLEWAKAC
jgi:hypothetical protein